MTNHDAISPHGHRFSLRTLILIVTISAMAFGLVGMNLKVATLTARIQGLVAENLRLRDELGELSIDDETQLHAIRTASGEELEWAWRIWRPEGHEYKLRVDGGSVPKSGYPTEGGTFYLRDPGEMVVRYRIARDPRDEKWYGSLSTRGGSVGSDRQDWVEWSSTTSTTSGVGTTTRSFSEDDDQTVELCRHMVSQQKSSSKIEDPAAGFVIWMERIK